MSCGWRIVSVVDPLGQGAGAATLSACAQAVQSLGEGLGAEGVEVGVLGNQSATQRAIACGLAPAWRVPVVCDNPRLTALTLSRVLDRSEPGVVLAWGARAARIVSRAQLDAPMVVVMDSAFESCDVARAELAEVLCLGDGVADLACARGWLPIRIRSIMPSMPSWGQEPSNDRNSLRREWGATDQDCVLGLLPLSRGRGDALMAFHALGRCAMAGHGAHLILHPEMGNASEVRSIARKLGLNARVHFTSALELPWKVCPAVDAWISMRDKHVDETALHHACSAALGAPIVAQEGSCAATCVEHRVDGLVAGEGVNGLAHELIQLARHPAWHKEMAGSARVKHAAQNVRGRFTLAIQECLERVCPEVFAHRARWNRSPADTKLSAAST